jgi:YggT family protein
VAVALLLSRGGLDGTALLTLAVLSVVMLIKAAVWLLIIVVLAQAILSWVAPDGPLAGLLNALTYRFLSPIRRRLPPLGGTLDLSPLIVIVLAQLVLMLPLQWLEGMALTLFR